MNELLSVEQVAMVLDLTPRTVRGYLRDGRLKGVRVGKEWRIHQDDFERFLDATGVEEARRRGVEEVERYLNGEGGPVSGSFQVCAAMDCIVEAPRAREISQIIMDHVHAHGGRAKFQYTYDLESGRGRYILWGTPEFVGAVLSSVGEFQKSSPAAE